MNKKKSFTISFESLDTINGLTDEEAGKIFKSIKDFKDNIEINLNKQLTKTWEIFKCQLESVEYGNSEINFLFSEMEKITDRPRISGQMQRNFASSWLKELAKRYPEKNNIKIALTIIKMAMQLNDKWHSIKAHNFKHLKYNWQEIIALWKINNDKYLQNKNNSGSIKLDY